MVVVDFASFFPAEGRRTVGEYDPVGACIGRSGEEFSSAGHQRFDGVVGQGRRNSVYPSGERLFFGL